MSAPVSLDRRKFVRALLASPLLLSALAAPPVACAAPNDEVAAFRYRASQEDLEDLRRRLTGVRWPERETVTDWAQGVPLATLRSVVDYWRDTYDWRRTEADLSRFAQFRTEIDGLGIHFVHARSRHPDALPIILTHGWPSTILLFRDVVGPLTDPTAHGARAEDAFHVVIPSLPGFGLSDKPTAPGWNAARTARAWAILMQRLGYRGYVAQGGDWGAYVTTAMAQQHPDGLEAIHLNFPQVIPDQIPARLSAEEQRAVDKLNSFRDNDSAYFAVQATRPQTVGYALMDSPAGLAAWIYEPYHRGTDNRGNAADAISLDKILDEITLYWLTDTATSSVRFYFEQAAVLGKRNNPGRVDLPVGVSVFPKEVLPAPRSWADQVYPDLIQWNELPRGGHFAALEVPDLFVAELREFAGKLKYSGR
jgi:pimeloyl-ACP methyl ester carboxylesterase